MAQNYTINCFDPNNAVQTDMQAIEDNFECLRTTLSGSGAPSNAIAGMQWAHAGGANGLRFRNVANSAWLAVILGDADSKFWLYRNDAAPGMAVDTTVTDRVLSIKGGSQAYDVDGGETAGSWTITGLSSNSTGAHTHSGETSTVSATSGLSTTVTGAARTPTHSHTYTTDEQAAHSHTVSHAGTSRPAAAVGTLQYPVLT